VIGLLLALALGQADFERVEVEAVQRPGDDGISLMEQWRAAHRGSADEARALLWEAQRRMAQGRHDDARALLLLAREARPQPELAWDLSLTLADLLALDHRYTEAAAAYDALSAPPGSRWAEQAQLRSGAMHAAAQRRVGMFVLAGLGAAILLARALRARRSLWPAPQEVTWSAPVLGLLAVAGCFRPLDERIAVLVVSLGGLVLLWVTGASLRTRALSSGARVVEVLIACFLSASLLFCAITAAELWPRVMDTVAGGAE
jgi:hypothetical protein